MQAFSLDAYAAYELFTKRKISDEERVDVFLADLKRLACLARLPDEAVRLAFVVGLPEAVFSRFRAAKEIIDVMLPKVRAALNRKSANESNITAATTRRNDVRTKSPESIVCYNCRGLNHITKNCAAPKRNVRYLNVKVTTFGGKFKNVLERQRFPLRLEMSAHVIRFLWRVFDPLEQMSCLE